MQNTFLLFRFVVTVLLFHNLSFIRDKLGYRKGTRIRQIFEQDNNKAKNLEKTKLKTSRLEMFSQFPAPKFDSPEC